MKTIKNAVFLESKTDFSNYEGYALPEIVLVGRSNVGKSSLINMLGGQTKLAKVSQTQGKTKLVNFFKFNREFIVVDLPGYGYAKTSKVEMQRWGKMIENYFSTSTQIKMAILLVDVRLVPSEQDIEMFEYCAVNNIPVTIVATKYDKIKKSERLQKLSQIANTFNVGVQNIFVASSEDSTGKDALVERIYQFVGAKK